jgi:hypothetical protein
MSYLSKQENWFLKSLSQGHLQYEKIIRDTIFKIRGQAEIIAR